MMGDKLEVTPGTRICVVGRGTANLLHAHYRVKRTTKTLFVVSRIVNGREVERRYRYDGREVGASEYGGSFARTECQRKKEK